jgi:hypothetical protein
MRKTLILLCSAAIVGPLLGGCVSTATAVVKAPFQAVGKGVDWATTSQEEADRNRGKKIRKQEEKDRKAAKKAAKRRDD